MRSQKQLNGNQNQIILSFYLFGGPETRVLKSIIESKNGRY